MPSESAKKRQAQKKEKRLAASRAAQKRLTPVQQTGKENGEKGQLCTSNSSSQSEGACAATPSLKEVDGAVADLKLSARSCTGVLGSHPASRDVHIEMLSITFHGAEIVTDARLELNCGRRYGLVGLNGSGKSTLLSVIGGREIPIPKHIDIFHLSEEMPPSSKTPLQCVKEVDEERIRLEREVEELTQAGDTDSERLMDIYERLEDLDASTAETKAARILHGLGFTAEMQEMKCSDFSGGWRMRISLARALFVRPTLLLLDEPTNHLDLEACVWLEEELKKYKRILMLVSHSQDFLNGVCTNIIHLHQNQLLYYGGNYDSYVRTRAELEENQMKRYQWERDQMQHMKVGGNYLVFCHDRDEGTLFVPLVTSFIFLATYLTFELSNEKMEKACATPMSSNRKVDSIMTYVDSVSDYIARFGHGSAKLARQAQSKEKVLAKMVAGGLTEKVVADKVVSFSFPDCGGIPPPVIMVQGVSFRYAPEWPWVYKNLDFGIDLETRVALVGPNGAGKSTLLKLIDGELIATDGLIRKHAHVRTGRYHQHLKDYLDLNESALRYMMQCYPEEKDEEQMRRALGRYGLTGKQQICPMRNLSDGQRCRVVFAWLAFRRPHLLLLDEPTNHLDMETIDALASAINSFEGGMMLVSHDFRLISQVATEIWVCEKQGVHPWQGDIQSYKEKLRKRVAKS